MAVFLPAGSNIIDQANPHQTLTILRPIVLGFRLYSGSSKVVPLMKLPAFMDTLELIDVSELCGTAVRIIRVELGI